MRTFQASLSAILSCALALLGTPAAAMEPPTKEMVEQYRRDGSLAGRIRAARELGNHRVNPELALRADYRLRRQLVEQFGTAEDKARISMTPPPAWRGMPTTGQVKVLVLCIDFSDYPHDEAKNSPAQMNTRIFGNGDNGAGVPYESLRNYYLRASYNKLDIRGNVLGWYRPAYTRSSIAQTTAGRQKLIKEALDHYNAQGHDFTQYDNNNDGSIDYIAIVWSGPNNGWSNFWWGYQTSWNTTATPISLDGKTLKDYSWQWESNPTGGYFKSSTLIHETGHALGLPDLYDYDEAVGISGGVGGLDMMDASRGDHNCFHKFLLDWINPSVITGARTGVQLRAAETTEDAVIVMPGAVVGNAFGEFFMVQNRRRTGNDATYPTDGLLVWHVDSRLNQAGTDYLYDNSFSAHKYMRLMEADGLEEIEQGGGADAGDFYVSGRTFGPTTTPNSMRYDGLATWLGLANISAAMDPMTFDVTQAAPDATAPTGLPTTPTDEGTSSQLASLTFNWTQGSAADPESGITAYQLQVGSTPGGSDLFDGIFTGRTARVPSVDAATHYARVRARNGAGLFTGWSGNSDGIRVDFPVFPGGPLDNGALTFKTIGDVPWIEDTSVKFAGASSARSGTIADLQTSTLLTRVVGPGTLNFAWKVSSEKDYDYLTFHIDGAAQPGALSGEVDWIAKSVSIPAGVHTVAWVYAKDGGVVEGQDRAWVDQVAFQGAGPNLDVNADGLVDAFDLLEFLKRFGSTTGADLSKADFNSDGQINDTDLNALLAGI